jgi:hypothetical protein
LISFFSYNICVRQEAGYCCIQYSLCADASSFTIDAFSQTANLGDIGTGCIQDYIEIEGSGFVGCGFPTGFTPTNTRYCGRVFSIVSKAAAGNHLTICGKQFLMLYKMLSKEPKMAWGGSIF